MASTSRRKASGGGSRGGPGKKGGGSADDLTAEENLRRATVRLDALERELVFRSEEAAKALAAEQELRRQLSQMHTDLAEEQEARRDITADMTRQYQAMETDSTNRLHTLEATIDTLKQDLDASRLAMEEQRQERDQIVAAKEKTISDLKRRMEEMALEFGEMLKETLDKVTSQIEATSHDWKDVHLETTAATAEFLKSMKVEL